MKSLTGFDPCEACAITSVLVLLSAQLELFEHLPVIIVIIIMINEYLEAGLTASISVQHIYYKHELQQELYY